MTFVRYELEIYNNHFSPVFQRFRSTETSYLHQTDDKRTLHLHQMIYSYMFINYQIEH